MSPGAASTVVGAAVVVGVAGGAVFGARGSFVATGLLLASAAVGIARVDAIDRPARAAPPGTMLAAEATLLERPRAGLFGSSAPLEIETGPARGLRVLARFDGDRWPATEPGVRFRMRALVRTPSGGPRSAGPSSADPASGRPRSGGPPSRGPRSAGPPSETGAKPSEANAGRPGTPGFGPLPARESESFDFPAFLRSRGIGREVEVRSLVVTGRRGGIQGIVDSVRRRTERAVSVGLAPDRGALARGMVLGQDGDVPDHLRDDFRRSGLAHLLAASGQNVALLCALVLPVLMLAGASPRIRVTVLLPLIGLYVALAGSGASIVRAGVMAAAILVAVAAGRPGSAVYALLLAGAVTLLANPLATADPGWRLSFAAVAGMFAFGPSLAGLLRPLPRALAQAVGATIAATVATAPLLAHEFGAVSLAALPANLAVFPAVAPVMWIGMGQGAVAQLGALGPPFDALARELTVTAAAVSNIGLRWIETVAARSAALPPSQVEMRLGGSATFVVYALMATLLIAAAARRARGRPRRLERLLDKLRCVPRRWRVRIGVAAAASVTAALAATSVPSAPPRGLSVTFVDVGQGDATLIRDPSGAAILFDGGPPEARIERTLQRLGIRRLSLVVATHQSRDHQGGLAQVVRRFPVGLFVDGGDGTADRDFALLRREVARRGVPSRPARAGDVLRVGQTTVRILWPPPREGATAPDDPNERATVALVSHGSFDLLLTADAESPSLMPLPLPRADAMKVPHHGSEDPGLAQVLERVRPAIAAIEVGRGNRYGHPRRVTLDALRNRVARVYRTDRDGTVELTVNGDRVAIRTHR